MFAHVIQEPRHSLFMIRVDGEEMLAVQVIELMDPPGWLTVLIPGVVRDARQRIRCVTGDA